MPDELQPDSNAPPADPQHDPSAAAAPAPAGPQSAASPADASPPADEPGLRNTAADAGPLEPAAADADPFAGSSASTPGPAPADAPAGAASPPNGNLLDQAELDALTGQLGRSAIAEVSNTIDQAELDALAAELAVAGVGVSRPPSAAAVAEPDPPPAPTVFGADKATLPPEAAQTFTAPELGPAEPAQVADIDLLDDVELDVKVELGRTSMFIEDVLRLGPGAVVELDKLAGDPVDVYVNEKLVARGEVLVLNDNFCVRINNIQSPIPELEHG